MYKVAFKNGIGSYYDEDGCDWEIAEIPSNNIPQVNDVLDLECVDEKSIYSRKSYLVREVKRSINLKSFGEWIYVYVIEIG